jgi:hypothetical protein
MAKYRKVDPRIWNDAKFRELSDNGKLVFFMLLTHPNMTSLGAMRASVAGLAEEMGWTLKAFREAFAEALSKGMAEHDEKACLIALPRFIKYNPPESPNVVKAWVKALDLLPECGLKTRVVMRAKGYAEGLGKGFGKALPEAFSETLPKSMPNQEQEQEQDSKPSQGDGYAFEGKTIKLNPGDYQEITNRYPNLDIDYQLQQLDLELRGKKNWFVEMNSKLNYRNKTPAHHARQGGDTEVMV